MGGLSATPNLTFTSCPNRKSKFNIKQNHISTTARGKQNHIFVKQQNRKSKFNIKQNHISTTARPLLPVQTRSQSLILNKIISQQPQEVNSQFLNHCTDRYL